MSDLSPLETWSSDHRVDIEAVRAYMTQRPDAVANVRVDSNGTFKLRVLLCGADTSEIQDEIRELLRFPDDLAFEAAQFSPTYLDQVLDEVRRLSSTMPAGTVSGYGPGWDDVSLHLAANREDLARNLHERFGAAVTLTVGALPYPLGRALTAEESLGGGVLGSSQPELPSVRGLDARLEWDSDDLISGSRLQRHVTLVNTTSESMEFVRGPAVVAFLDQVTRQVVGGFSGYVTAVGIHLSLAPGESTSIDAIADTASFKSELGYVLPPGDYLARATIRLSRREGQAHVNYVIRTPEIEVTLLGQHGNHV